MSHNNTNDKPKKHDPEAPTQTTSNGAPVDNNMNSLTAGQDGPLLLSDFTLIDKLAHFDRERIPERVVHAKGSGAHGYFEVTKDITQYSRAALFNKVGKKTPILARFSTVGGEKGSADTERDPRGFAVKFYTEEGNWDLVGNNTPIFFIRDPSKFPDFIHTQKRNPQNNCKDPNMFWDFLSLNPESVHQVSILFSDRGTPDGYRHMHGFGSHTFKLINDKDEVHLVKFHFITESGVKNLSAEEADKLKMEPDYATKDLFDHIQKGQTAEWTLKIQVMPIAQAATYKWNVLDVTKVWPHADFPLIEVGRMVLNKNPVNHFAEIEQVAFAPSHVVPGIEPSEDRMLQGRLFSYPDTQRHRLGVNYDQIPVNCPYRSRIANGHRDGNMQVNGNQGPRPNYEPNSFHAYAADPKFTVPSYKVTGLVQRYNYAHPNSDFEQPGALYRRVLDDKGKTNLVNNLVGHLGKAERFLQERQVKIFHKCDPEYGDRVARGLGFPATKAKL